MYFWDAEKVNFIRSENGENRENFSMGHDLNFNLLYKILCHSFSLPLWLPLSFALSLSHTLSLVGSFSYSTNTIVPPLWWNYNSIKKITVWKLVARNEDAFDRVRCLHPNKRHHRIVTTQTLTLKCCWCWSSAFELEHKYNHHILKRSSTRFNKLF